MKINIAFSSDDNYSPFLCTAIYSLLANSELKNKYHIYILDGGISPENKNKLLKSIDKFKNKKLFFIQVNKKYFKKVKQFLQLNRSSYYRLLLPNILPDIKKIIYCDCDILVLKDISKLYQIKLNQKIIGCSQVFHPNYQQVLSRMYPKSKINNAINSGITLMNLDKLRKDCYTSIFIEFVNKNSSNFIAGDQDVLNVILSNKIKIIHPKWNTTSYIFVTNNSKKSGLSQKCFNTCVKNPSIVHFDGIKPWSSGSSHPYKKVFLRYLKQTEFKDYRIKFNFKKFIKNKIFYSGNKIANLLPYTFYKFIEKQYLKNNFIEKRYRQIINNGIN